MRLRAREDPVASRLPRWVVVLVGLVLVGTGLVLALRPFRSLAVLVLLLVLALAVSGVGDLLRGRRPWGPLRGVAALAAALALLLWPGPGIGLLVVVVAVTLVVDGALDVVEGLRRDGPDRVAGWADLLGGAAVAATGLLALAWQDVALLVVAVAFGVRMVLLGVRLLGRRRPATAAPARSGRRLARAVAAVVGVAVLASAGVLVQRGHPRPDAFYGIPEAVPAEPGRLLRAEPFATDVPEGASAWRILYTTTREDGVPAVASGLVVRPDAATGPTPVVLWAHGTTGWAPGCAPSVLGAPFESGALMVLDEVVEQGWTLVATDYVGLGTESPHPYVIGQGEARSVLDSLRAAQQLDEVDLDDRTVVWGHSQGGHAALWTGMLAPSYAPELRLDGVAALAPASDLESLVQVVEGSRLGALFAVYVVQAYSSVYDDVRYADYVRPGAHLLAREMAQRCLSERGILVSVGQSLLLDKPIWDRDPTTGPFGRRLAENVPSGPVEAPLLVGQGGADTLITPRAQDAFVAGLCAGGQPVDYRTYEGHDHLSVVAADSPAIAELLEWTQDRLDGAPAEDAC